MPKVHARIRVKESSCDQLLGSLAAIVTIVFAVLFCIPATAQTSKSADVGWPMYNGGYAGDRFSSLKQITKENVGNLVEIARRELPETTSFQTGPVVVGNTMYVTTATATYAINAVTGKLLWTQKYAPKSLGLGTPVRGVAYSEGKLYRGTPDAHVLALDAKTGKVLWDVAAGDATKGEYFTVAPLVWEGRIYIGTSGSDVGTVGRMMALDVRDGHKLWNFDVVPPPVLVLKRGPPTQQNSGPVGECTRLSRSIPPRECYTSQREIRDPILRVTTGPAITFIPAR